MKKLYFLLILLFLTVPGEASVNMEAIAMIESSVDPLAVSNRPGDKSWGLFQITFIALEDFNRMNPERHLTAEDMFDPVLCLEVAEWLVYERIPRLLKHYGVEVTEESVVRAFNGGAKRLSQTKKPTDGYYRKYKEALKLLQSA